MANHSQGSSSVKERIDVHEPDMYDVVLINDDFTTMDFVIEVLQKVFFKCYEEAYIIMMTVHLNGEDIAGTYTYDIAQSKVKKATAAAREAGFPLRLKINKHS